MKFTREEIIQKVKEGFDFTGMDIKGLDLTGADLKGGKFQKVNFRYTVLKEANLEKADLREAILRHVVLVKANLSGADLSKADLTHADLRGANLVGARLKDAKVDGAKGISEKVFFTQAMIDSLAENNKLSIDGDVITILTKKKASFNIVPAYRFIKVESGEDKNKLLGKVKSEKELKELNIEVMSTSAICGETVYTVESGFIGIPVSEEMADKASSQKQEKEKKDSLQMLAEFILKNT